MRFFFLVGCGRSGTTMLQQALNRHSRIVIPPETGFFLDFLGHTRRGQRQHLRRINADLGIDISAPRQRVYRSADVIATYREIAHAYVRRLGRDPATTVFGEKSPRHLLCLPRIRKLFPEAPILLMYRDGRDVARSLSRVPWSPPDIYVNFAIWLRYNRWHQWALSASDAKLLCVKYEQLALDPETELRVISAVLDVDYEPSMAEGAGNREGVPEWEYAWKEGAFDPIHPGKIERWRVDLTDVELKRLERWGSKALTALGYPLATDCSERLPWHFFPVLWMKHLGWRLRRGVEFLSKELLGR